MSVIVAVKFINTQERILVAYPNLNKVKRAIFFIKEFSLCENRSFWEATQEKMFVIKNPILSRKTFILDYILRCVAACDTENFVRIEFSINILMEMFQCFQIKVFHEYN